MSNVGSNLLQCESVQDELVRYYTTCNHDTLHRPSPFLQFLMSEANRSGIQQVITPGAGKLKTAILRYDQKIPVSSVAEIDQCGLTCSSDNMAGDLSVTVSIDPCIKDEYNEGIDAITLATICRDNMDYVFGRINKAAAALEAKVATKFAEEALALIGKYATDVSPTINNQILQVATLLSGGINIDPRFVSKISLAAMKTGYCTSQAIFGSSMLWEASDNLNAGCCASSGYNLLEMLQRYGKLTAWDPYVVAAYNGDDRNAIMTQLGALQPIFANLGTASNFEGITGPRATNFEVIPMVTPRYNIPFDLTLSNNCGALSWSLSTVSKLTGMPLDMFPVDDVQEGVNFVNEIQVTNP